MNEPTLTFSFYDPHSADTYNVEYEASGAFVEALRYPCQTWMNTRVYENLADIPEPHRSGIANEIARRIHK